MIYEYRDQVLKPGKQISVRFKCPHGPTVVITVDPDMFSSLKAMNYGSMRVSDNYVIRRLHLFCEYEAFVSQLNLTVVKKILAALNNREPEDINLTRLPVCTGKPDFRELARMLAAIPMEEYLEQEGL